MVPLIAPAGILTTVLFGAEEQAELMFAAVGVEKAVLQAVVVQFAHEPLGIPPGIPAFDQSIARFGARMPDHDWLYESVENNSNSKIKTRGGRCE